MENIIYTDADLNAFLLANEEQTGNTIAVVIEADATASQVLTITAGEATTTEAVTPSTKNRIEVPSMLWNFGDDTVITLSKGGTDVGTITIHFPAAIDTDAALNETETDNEFTLQGSASVQDQIVSLQESVERVSAQTLAYILPSAVDQSGIADGGSNTVETFDFEAGEENVKVAFFTCIQFLATTTVTAANAYEDLDITVTLTLDGNPIATILQAYRDGRQVLTLNHLVENLSKGNHTLTVAIAAAGGSVSVMQIIAAYLLTAKSTNSGNVTSQVLFENDFAPGVLPDGLNKELLTKEAYLNGTNINAIKYLRANTESTTPDINDLNAYFLTDYVLATEMIYGKLFYINNGAITRDDITDHLGSLDTHFFIPIKRMTGFNRITCMAKNEGPDSPLNGLLIYAAAIVDGLMVRPSNLAYTINQHNWGPISWDISELPYVDYIVVACPAGRPYYKDIKLQKVTS